MKITVSNREGSRQKDGNLKWITRKATEKYLNQYLNRQRAFKGIYYDISPFK